MLEHNIKIINWDDCFPARLTELYEDFSGADDKHYV